jgi:hypothetical protein
VLRASTSWMLLFTLMPFTVVEDRRVLPSRLSRLRPSFSSRHALTSLPCYFTQQLIPTCRRVVYASALLADPGLQEPVYQVSSQPRTSFASPSLC